MLVLYAVCTGAASLGMVQKLAHRLLSAASSLSDRLIPLVYAGLVPDFLVRWGIRLRLRDHLVQLASVNAVATLETKMRIVQELTVLPIAVETAAANAQHYEVPTAFYNLCLGP